MTQAAHLFPQPITTQDILAAIVSHYNTQPVLAQYYASGIVYALYWNHRPYAHSINWPLINQAILDRYRTQHSLNRIKTMAWDLIHQNYKGLLT